MKRKRLFMDIDGTAAIFKPVDTLETLYEKNYFRNLAPQESVVAAMKLLIEKHSNEIEVFALSSYLSDSSYALDEKNQWLDEHIPQIDKEHRIYCPCGKDKKDFVPGGIRPTDYLLDDYTHNLILWEPPARGIKLLNGINHTHGTWKSQRIRMDKNPDTIASNIHSIIMDGKHVLDSPQDMNKNQSRNAVDLLCKSHSPGKKPGGPYLGL